MSMFAKSTGDNPDNLYLSAHIDGNNSYRIKGKAEDFRHWRGEQPANSGATAPCYAIFSAITQFTGDSGNLGELVPDVTRSIAALDSTNLQVDSNGQFEIIIAPERPEGYTGNYMPSRETTEDGKEHVARYLICRELFCDWDREEGLCLEITKIGQEGKPQAVASPETVVENIQRMGDLVNNQMRFWNSFYSTLLNHYGDSPMPDTPYSFPGINQVIKPAAPSSQVGAAQETNIYSGGCYQLEEGEALIVEQSIPVKPLYSGFGLCNWWGESYDFASYTSSLNSSQVSTDTDGIVRYVIAHRDPGVMNWLDTTGHSDGMICQRWVYTAVPEYLPEVRCKKVRLDEVLEHLPKETVKVDAEERRNIIARRQQHMQRRFRLY
jgi:hypothetical protein